MSEEPFIKFQPTGDFIHIEILPVCDHPADAILWNPWNLVTQCHRCGTVIEALSSHEHEWSDWVAGMVGDHRYCLCGEAQMRSPLSFDYDSGDGARLTGEQMDAVGW